MSERYQIVMINLIIKLSHRNTNGIGIRVGVKYS